MEKLYQTSTTIGRLFDYFAPYLTLLTKPSGRKLFLLLLAMVAVQYATSINHLFKWFLRMVDGTSLNAYYYLLGKTVVPLDKFAQITVGLALSLIPDELKGLPVFLIIDDTLQPKFGVHFECYKTMYDHARHNGSNYLKGHCFVAMAICVPVMDGSKMKYLHVPVGFRLRNDESKLEMASALVELAMEEFPASAMAILLCDSWYPKGEVLKTVKKHENLELIANIRVDTCIYDLPPKSTGKRGRPAKKGRQLDIHADFDFIRVGDYFIAVRTALTNLFGDLPVYITVTTPDVLNHKTYRVFISSVDPTRLEKRFSDKRSMLSDTLGGQILWLLPLFLYSFRWLIEVMFYEQKTFWSFGLYRLRSKEGIANFVNFSSMCYACMKLLPRFDDRFSMLLDESPQTCKFFLGEAIRSEIFLYRFMPNSENRIKSSPDFDLFAHLEDFLLRKLA